MCDVQPLWLFIFPAIFYSLVMVGIGWNLAERVYRKEA